MPVRRFAARFALVEEEADRRADLLRDELQAVHRDLEELRAELRRVGDRIEEPQRTLLAEVERVRRENAAILRLAGASDGQQDPARPLTREGLFRELERGSRQEVKAKLEGHLRWFEGREPIVDLGCGRGEFLELAAERGLAAYGVDLDAEAVEECRALGLDARYEDALAHLDGLADGALGGVFSSQVVEHLPPDLLPSLMAGVARVLRADGIALMETPNPATFATHVKSFWRDPTHLRPVPPEALAFAARTSGLVVDRIVYSAPCSEEDRLRRIEAEPEDGAVRAVVRAVNSMVDRLNDTLFGYQDYAMILSRP